MLMQGLKKFGLVVAVGLFGPLFLLSVFSLAFTRTIGNRDYTKQAVQSAGLYTAVGETIKNEALGSEGATDPLITAALQSALSGDQLQNTLEPLIDGTYGWLGGETQQPQFTLAIEPLKANFQQGLTASLQARAASLPACTTAAPTGDDVFTYSCIPPGTDVNALITDAVTKISNNASVFSDEVVADGTVSTEEAQDLGINDPTQNLPDELPKLYQFLNNGFWFFVAGTLLAGVGTVLLSLTWLHGLRKLGVLLVVNGAFTLVTGLILSWVVSSIIPTTSIESTEAAVNALQQASKIILADNASMFKLVGLAAAVLGVIAIVTSTMFLRKDKKPSTPAKPENPTPPPTDTPEKEKQPQPKS